MPYATEQGGSTIELVVLQLLTERTMYGYEIIQVVNQRTDGAFNWKEGTLYPVLHRLEARGLLTTEWQTADNGKRRRYYALTRDGKALAAQKVKEWQAYARSVNAILCQPARHGASA